MVVTLSLKQKAFSRTFLKPEPKHATLNKTLM